MSGFNVIKEPKVTLVEYTPDPEKLINKAASICYLSDENKNLIPLLLKNGHLSPLEHANFTFLIEGMSRNASHQLVRHRVASYTQQSFRYTKVEDVFLPASIGEDKEVLDFIEKAFTLYQKKLSEGVRKEDARYLLPSASASSIYVTMNARELRHFFDLRTTEYAQKEIRDIALKMLELVKPIAPSIFNSGKDALP
ncbi:MAG TPA: FAD-dependent thymidylate synthase [Candidatus Deferrimicrobium sp.]|nr:FAD-dependent thymidylate synthase [Candidatus Deferrimicrobium sp.]